MTSYTINDGDGGAALDENQQHYRGDGIGVVDPDGGDLAVSINTGALGSNDTLSVAQGDAYIQGTTHSISGQSVGIDGANGTDPRRDVVYVDTNGDLQVENGTPEATESAVDSPARFEYFRPAPPDLSGTVACVIAEVWVPAGATSIASSDLRDRRIRALHADSIQEDLATQTELNSHESDVDAHHTQPTAGTGLTSSFDVQERVHYEPGHTEVPDGDNDVEYHRIVPPSGGTVTITAMQFNQQGGGTSANATLDVYDVGAASVINQITLGSQDRSTYTAAEGNTVLVRMSNSTGSVVNAAPVIDGYIA